MDFHQFFDFLVILKESIKLLAKNLKLTLFITTLSLLSSSIFFIVFDFSSLSLARDMLAKESLIPISSSNSAEFTTHLSRINHNFPYLLAVYVVFVLSYLIITLTSTVAIIIVSSESYYNKSLSLTELSSRIAKSWTRTLVTGFYTTVFVIGYVFFAISWASPFLASSSMSMLGAAVLLWAGAYGFYLYLCSVWILSLVVSVVDEDRSCGVEALGRSAVVMKGQRVSAFLVNVVCGLITLGVFFGSRMTRGEKICGLVLVNGSCFVKIFTFVAYTVLYCRGKGSGGQEIELNRSDVEYAKLGITPLVNNTG
ncbi:uncharacterized protein LOC105155871 [Sesamum indicum]|uniref:Uncharacterized protein LOC105155871 n=1 Tax=Sesamum indicum TaxID=4182 RepID=A0A6I9SSN6_SESIN|nr:uncharacterized protein LOC105155871 [Sesamum indicum]